MTNINEIFLSSFVIVGMCSAEVHMRSQLWIGCARALLFNWSPLENNWSPLKNNWSPLENDWSPLENNWSPLENINKQGEDPCHCHKKDNKAQSPHSTTGNNDDGHDD